MLKIFSNKGEAGAIPLNAENLNFNFTELINILHPIGEYFYTSDANFNPNTAWCGTWTLENDGTVLVSKSNESDSAFNINVESVVGEEKHKLTIEELTEHAHDIHGNTSTYSSPGVNYYQTSSIFGGYAGGEQKILFYNGFGAEKTGGDQPHNNIQPSKICFRWHRTA